MAKLSLIAQAMLGLTIMCIPYYSYADCKAMINNFTGQSWEISFSPDHDGFGLDVGNIYFISTNPVLCPTSTTHHGVPKNGPCTIEPGQNIISYTEDKFIDRVLGDGVINNLQGKSYKFHYANQESANMTCPTIEPLKGETLPANIKLNDPSPGSITVEDN